MVSVIYSDEFLEHKTGILHPERPERLTAIVTALKAFPNNGQLQWHSPTPVQQRDSLLMTLLEKVHSRSHIKAVAEIADHGGGFLDTDTPVFVKSYDVALLAVSAWLDGVDLVLTNRKPTFVLARPPGHHAESIRGMGFCLFSNAAIAAHYALEKLDINKVAILDWDVHHGNGTQEIVETNENIAYCSLHQYPCYPGTGSAEEHGFYNNVLNLPMSPGSTIANYQKAFKEKVIPFLANFQPDLLIVSAGYDANHDDPLASISLQPEDYRLFTEYCLQITRKILFGLEGGYDLPSLSKSVLETIEACLVN
ncbi:MAG: histone deacetylase [Trichodesmium sp. St16_bin4-tuft]|nr:histone deacetylase [Trichodesmium sp. MAG_R01]MDE5069502.1 histone deacetylase [Trichodesmium sp. St4_bin8_1]MDE5073083.1 histone deacetylase [Trichodesmium sp. St5_bin8]MDE5078115.1 histone deacetylase [Trichodesmium sp. St2_bin6]MDE5099020.1 histone deacetylase [Trichodesmium sp. St16_bin4-tuft]MDE5103828.1 histone deacetylase [Trichodesmium sp. St19_bin2]